MYLDERLVTPKKLRPIIMQSQHYGHPGRDSMLATVSNVWWPKLHGAVIAIARKCPQCSDCGENKETVLRQKQESCQFTLKTKKKLLLTLQDVFKMR